MIPRFPTWIPLGAAIIALGYLPTLTAPFDFIDDGNLVYPAPAGTSLAGHADRWWDKVAANVEHLGPFRPTLWVHWELTANMCDGNPVAWRAGRLLWCGLAAGMLLWLMRELNAHPTAALVATAAAMWNPYRNEIWTSLTLAEGVAMPYALLALIAARKAGTSSRPWVWDLVSILGVMMALGCKNVFVAIIPAQVALRIWQDGVSWRAGWKGSWPWAYLVPLLLPIGHFIYFKLNWHPGQYETPGPSFAQAGRILLWLKGAAGLDFLSVGVLAAIACLWGARKNPGTVVPGLFGVGRAPMMVGVLLLLAGAVVYLPVPMMAPRYTMPGVWGADILLATLLTALMTCSQQRFAKVAWVAVGSGLAVMMVANIGRQEKVAARATMLWQVVHELETTAPDGAAVAWVSGESETGGLNVEEGIHVRWHLLHRGRGDIRIGLCDATGAPVERVELPPLTEMPTYRVTTVGEPPLGWRMERTFVTRYRLGRKQFTCRLEGPIPASPAFDASLFAALRAGFESPIVTPVAGPSPRPGD